MERERRRPKNTSTNARIALPIFGNDRKKRLPIPTVINAYNHAMNAVDVANQIRANFTCHLAFERRNWRPLAWWLFDVCLVNSYVIWRQRQPQLKQQDPRLHRQFSQQLIDQLLFHGPGHKAEKMPTRRRCAWGSKHPGECVQGAQSHKSERQERRIRRRRVLGEIINESRPVQRSKNIATGCASCGVNLCITRGCFYKWHVNLHRNLLWNSI